MRKVKIYNNKSVGNYHDKDCLGTFEVKGYVWRVYVYLSMVCFFLK